MPLLLPAYLLFFLFLVLVISLVVTSCFIKVQLPADVTGKHVDLVTINTSMDYGYDEMYFGDALKQDHGVQKNVSAKLLLRLKYIFFRQHLAR